MKRKDRRRFGNLAFFLPVILVAAIVLFGLYESAGNGNGVLVVEAQNSYGSSRHFISAAVTVSGVTHQTPFNLSLTPGPYTVTYGPLQWYNAPLPKTVTVLGGKPAFAVGVYVPVPVIIGVNGASFNATKVISKSGITPVVWVDTGAQAVQLESSVFNIVLSAGQNYTRVLTGSGSLVVSLLGTSASMTVNVT